MISWLKRIYKQWRCEHDWEYTHVFRSRANNGPVGARRFYECEHCNKTK